MQIEGIDEMTERQFSMVSVSLQRFSTITDNYSRVGVE